jgi:chromosome segregation ATPase
MDPNGVSITVRAGNKSQRGTGERRGMLAEDLTEILRDLDGSITYLEELFRSQQGEHRDLRTQVDRCKGEERDLEGQLRNLGERLKQLHRQKLDLESQREECQSASQIDVTPLEQERDDREEAIRGMEAQCETIKTEIDGAKAALTVVTAEKSRVDTWKRDLSTQLKEMEERLQDTMGQRENARRNVDACLKAHQIKEKQVADVSRELETRICYQGEKVDFAKTQTRELLGERWDGEPYVLTEKETKERLRATIASKEKQLERGKLEAGLSGKTKESLHAKILASKRLYIEEKRKYDDI